MYVEALGDMFWRVIVVIYEDLRCNKPYLLVCFYLLAGNSALVASCLNLRARDKQCVKY